MADLIVMYLTAVTASSYDGITSVVIEVEENTGTSQKVARFSF